MENFKHILLPTDFSPSAEIATAYAAEFAKNSGGKLTLAHVSMMYEEDPYAEATNKGSETLQEPEVRVRRRMEDQLEAYQDWDIQTEIVQIRGLTGAETLSEYALRNQVDIIVMGTHGKRGFKRWLLGSVAEELVRRAPCPVLSIKDGWEQPPSQLENILVPIDFSLASRTALKNARMLAKVLNAKLQVLHVVQPPPYPDIYPYASMDDFFEEAREKSLEVMASLLAEEGPDVEASSHVLQGHPAREILKFAETHNGQMILIAHLGISGISDRILGSVTEHVMRGAQCPVLTADLGQ